MKEDLRQYGDEELSLIVFNEACFYNMRRDLKLLKQCIANVYKYTSAQMHILEQDLKEE